MRILWLSHLVPYPPKAGVLLRSFNLIRELSRYHEINLIAFRQDDFLETFYVDLNEGLSVARAELERFCENVDFVPIQAETQLLGKYKVAVTSLIAGECYTIRWLDSQNTRSAIRKLLTNKTFDLIHFDTISLCPFRDLISGGKISLGHHNIESHMLLRRADKEKSMLKSWYFGQEGHRLEEYERKVCSHFDINITCSVLDSERLRTIAPDATVVEVENGVDLQYFLSRRRTEHRRSLVFVGTMNWYPNIEAAEFLVAKIMPALQRVDPVFHLKIVGSSPAKSVIQIARENGNVAVTGYVDDVRPYIERAEVYVCPITDGGGTKLKLLDAFSMAKAVVCHPVAAEGIDVVPGRDVIFAENVTEFVDAIVRLSNNPNLRGRLGANARALVEKKYSYRSIGEKCSAIFEELVDTNKNNDVASLRQS